MKKFAIIITLLVTALSLSSCRYEYTRTSSNSGKTGKPQQQYVAGTEDMPVYQGFVANQSENVSYDSPEGRIVDASFYSTNVRAAEARKFYETTLKQLGWNKKSAELYERDGETLQLQISEKARKTLLRFVIKPSVS